MKYYIGFPYSQHCNIRCPYCFNKDFLDAVDNNDIEVLKKYRDNRTFTFEQYEDWRDKHLSDGTEFILHLYGGEPFCSKNIDDVIDIISKVKKEKIDILTNGVFNKNALKKLLPFKNKFHRIGFTYHRMVGINDNIFERNVLKLHEAGFNVYVKEMLIIDFKQQILNNKTFWKFKNVPFKIQDFKGMIKGYSKEEYKKYTAMDNLLIDNEYKKPAKTCFCYSGYKNLFIRGFDIADVWEKGGDVIACWHDPTIIGNIIEDWYLPNHRITKNQKGYNIAGVDKLYRGTHNKDLPKIEKR
jgi:MoaA/NifB/PqqE/SkfB family radical SAM enzyme